MANLGKSLSKLLSPCRYTFSVSPKKRALCSPAKSELGRKCLKFSEGIDVPKIIEHSLKENSSISSEKTANKAFKLNYNKLQIPKHDVPLITSPVTKKLTEKGVEGICYQHILGRGRFGTVIKGLYQDNPVAVKVIAKEHEKLKKDLKEENAVKLIHPNIIRVLKTVSSEGNYDIIMMEYCNGTNMLQKLNDMKFFLDMKRILRYASELGYALQHCHRNKIIHLDVKPENIIIDSEDHCKLCDFGSSRTLDSENGVQAPWPGTPVYAAPEVLQGCNVTCSVDIYSFGVTMWQMLSRETPYFGEDIHSVIYKVVTQNHRPKQVKPKNEEEMKYIKLYENCWLQNFKERPTTDELLLLLLQI